MLILRSKEVLRAWRQSAGKTGFIPTMGALHDGHLSLVTESNRRNYSTVASIFVNPTQFNNPNDLKKYPRDEAGDFKKLEEAGCDAVYVPEVQEIYPSKEEAKRYQHHFGRLEEVYEGAFRPDHFRGVGQVVHILFELVQPTAAFFGQKDFQQLQVIRRLVDIIGENIEIVGMPTVRETDGLAMSSRNLRLTDDQRQHATLLFRALEYARTHLSQLGRETILKAVTEMFEADALLKLEYFDVVNASTLEPYAKEFHNEPHGIISAFAGEIRLIDNLRMQ